MPSSYLILHGIDNHRPPQHWQFLLAAKLIERGCEVRYPGLPEPDAPVRDSWLSALDHELNALTGEERVVVCHSLACLLWFAFSERQDAGGDRARADRLLLVSPPASDRVPEAGASFRLSGFDARAVRESVRGEIAIACSDADPYNPAGAQTTYGDALGVTAKVFPGACHITPETGYGPWCFATEWCLGDGALPA